LLVSPDWADPGLFLSISSILRYRSNTVTSLLFHADAVLAPGAAMPLPDGHAGHETMQAEDQDVSRGSATS
jgi:hypothetical protein